MHLEYLPCPASNWSSDWGETLPTTVEAGIHQPSGPGGFGAHHGSPPPRAIESPRYHPPARARSVHPATEMGDPCVVDGVLAAGKALQQLLQQRLQQRQMLLHGKAPESDTVLLHIDTFVRKLEEKLAVLQSRGAGAFSVSSALTLGLLRQNLEQAAEFVGSGLGGGNVLSGSDSKRVERQLLGIEESVFSTFPIVLFVTALDVDFTDPGDTVTYREGLSSLELRISDPGTVRSSVVRIDSAQRLAALHSILRPVLAASAPERIDVAWAAISSPELQALEWTSFPDDVLAIIKDLKHGGSKVHEPKSVTQLRWYQDPLIWETMVDPVKCNDGRTYDRWTIINNKVTRGPFDNRDPFDIVCDDVDVRGRLFEKFPEQECRYLKLRRAYRDQAIKTMEQQQYLEAIVMLENVLKWAESDTQCKKLLVSAKCLLDEKSRRQANFDFRDSDEPSSSDIAMLDVQETPQISGELQSWMGWYRSDSLSFNISLEIFVTNQNRLYGHGSDANGDWVMEGHCTGDDVKFRLQYVYSREEQVLYVGKRYFKADGTEYMEGDRTRLRDLSHFRHFRGAFYLERVLSSTKKGNGQHWTGYWQDENTAECITHNSDIVFTSHNKLFGFGTDNDGRSFTYLGTYSQEGNRIRIAFLKLYEPDVGARQASTSCLQYWGQLFKGFAGLPTVMEGNWQSYTEGSHGGFRLETHSFPAVFPSPSSNSRLTPRIPGVLECWQGWYEEPGGFKKSMTASLYLTSNNRLCGYGNDYIGQWTWEGEYVGIHHVLLRKQYVTKPDHRIKFNGTKCFKDGKEILEGTWSIMPSRLGIGGPTQSGKFLLERETSSIKTAFGQLWTGYWQFSSGRRGTDDTEFVFTSHNKLFGFGSDMEGSFTHTGTYSQEGNMMKITTLKLYEAETSPYVYYWGLLHIRFQSSTVMEGSWANVKAGGEGTFRFETKDFSPELSPPSITSCVLLPHGVSELEVWEGWHQQSGRHENTTLVLYLTGSNRLCGFGTDLNGEWTCEGDGDGDRLELRKQYVDKPEFRVIYNGQRMILNDCETICGHWRLDSETQVSEAQTFFLKKDKTSENIGYGQHWTGYWETSRDGHNRGLDDTDFVFTSNNRIFGFGSDVEGTFTHIGTYSRDSYTVKVKMVKLYEPGTSTLVQYCGQIDMQFLDTTTTVMEGSWASVDGGGSGTFRFQTQDFDVETFMSVAGPLGPSLQSDGIDLGDEVL